jgi:hypothetical protein
MEGFLFRVKEGRRTQDENVQPVDIAVRQDTPRSGWGVLPVSGMQPAFLHRSMRRVSRRAAANRNAHLPADGQRLWGV